MRKNAEKSGAHLPLPPILCAISVQPANTSNKANTKHRDRIARCGDWRVRFLNGKERLWKKWAKKFHPKRLFHSVARSIQLVSQVRQDKLFQEATPVSLQEPDFHHKRQLARDRRPWTFSLVTVTKKKQRRGKKGTSWHHFTIPHFSASLNIPNCTASFNQPSFRGVFQPVHIPICSSVCSPSPFSVCLSTKPHFIASF